MLKRLWCLIVGHQFMVNFITSETITVTGALTGRPMVVPTYIRKPVPFCHRCGAINKNYEVMMAQITKGG